MKPMRRKDRQLPRQEAMELLQRGEYGVLATAVPEDGPYAVPLSYVVVQSKLYFHCARAGHKLDNLRQDNRACFCVVGRTQPVYDGDFTTYYESVLVFGRASRIEDRTEKTEALTALAQKYLPQHMDKAPGDIAASFEKTDVWAVAIEEVSGKAKRAG